MSLTRRLTIALLGLVALTAVGIVGFVLLEGMTLVDALYMTVQTLSTVGFGDVHPATPAGRLFTVALIVTGVGTALYLFGAIAELVLEGRLQEYLGRSAMERSIERLEGHVVVCGFGRFGRVVADDLQRNGVPVVIIDLDPDREPELVALGLPYVIGSALSDEVLERAGIRRARAIVVGTASDADNVFSAREKNPAIRIHARGESDGGLRRLRLAGADQALSAYHMGGLRIAASILRPSVVDFLEIAAPGRGEEVDLEEIRLSPGSPMVGAAIGMVEQRHDRLRIVALKREGEPIRLVPPPGTEVRDGDHLVVIGARRSLEDLAQLAQGRPARVS
jgi:voltage-gated potassium channel